MDPVRPRWTHRLRQVIVQDTPLPERAVGMNVLAAQQGTEGALPQLMREEHPGQSARRNVLGVLQENKAERSLEALQQLASPTARVVREGVTRDVPARELVPGDVVCLETGNFIPADVRLLEAANLAVEEAALTGESVPVDKDAKAEDIRVLDEQKGSLPFTLAENGAGKTLRFFSGAPGTGLVSNQFRFRLRSSWR